MSSHDELMATIRAHPDWFVHVHMVFGNKHSISKRPLGTEVGATAINLLQTFMSSEIESRKKHGTFQGTEQHVIDSFDELTNEHKEIIRTIPNRMTVDSSTTRDPKTCGKGGFITSVRLSEQDVSTVDVNPVCGECHKGCEVCLGKEVSKICFYLFSST